MLVELIADIFLVAGALGAALYCFVLARRLARFNDLETGIGGAVAVLSAQVDDLTKTLAAAQAAASTSTVTLEGLTDRADSVARRLELLVASLHDLTDVEQQTKTTSFASSEKDDMPRFEPMFTRHGRSEGTGLR
jgi:hypothetical protein